MGRRCPAGRHAGRNISTTSPSGGRTCRTPRRPAARISPAPGGPGGAAASCWRPPPPSPSSVPATGWTCSSRTARCPGTRSSAASTSAACPPPPRRAPWTRSLAPQVAAQRTVVAADVHGTVSPKDAGLALDVSATVAAAGHQPLNPWTRLTTLVRRPLGAPGAAPRRDGAEGRARGPGHQGRPRAGRGHHRPRRHHAVAGPARRRAAPRPAGRGGGADAPRSPAAAAGPSGCPSSSRTRT